MRKLFYPVLMLMFVGCSSEQNSIRGAENESGEPDTLERNVIRGPAGWDRLGDYFEDTNSVTEYQDTAKSSFRNVLPYLGRGADSIQDSL